MILTLSDIIDLMTSSNAWFFGVGVVVLLAMLVVKMIFKGIKWLVLLLIFGIIMFLLYGSLLARFSSEEVNQPQGTQRAQRNIISVYRYLQTRVFSLGDDN